MLLSLLFVQASVVRGELVRLDEAAEAGAELRAREVVRLEGAQAVVAAGGELRFDPQEVALTKCPETPAAEHCECYEKKTCSSCTLERSTEVKCPLGTLSVKPGDWPTHLSGGLSQRLADHLHSAYRVTTDSGRWVLKFSTADSNGKAAGQDFTEAVRFSQKAHALQVPTPRAAVVDEATCPELFAALAGWTESGANSARGELAEVLALWRAQKTPTVLAQEYVSADPGPRAPDFLPCTFAGAVSSHAAEFWSLVGRIAMFDWMIGKVDLFSDRGKKTPLGKARDESLWNATYLEMAQDNIMETPTQAVAVDLDSADVPAHLDAEFAALVTGLKLEGVAGAQEGRDGASNWVKTNVLPLMCAARRMSCAELGPYSSHNPKGFSAVMADAQIKYGMLLVAQGVLRAPGFFGFAASAAKNLPGLITEDDIDLSLRQVEKVMTENEFTVQPRRCTKCQVSCTARGSLFRSKPKCNPTSYVSVTQGATASCPALNNRAELLRCGRGCSAKVEQVRGDLADSTLKTHKAFEAAYGKQATKKGGGNTQWLDALAYPNRGCVSEE